MLVRRAEIKDIEKINELLLQVAMVHHYGRPDLFKANCRKYKNDELVEIVKDDNRPIFVAEDDGVVMGYAFCVITDRKDDNVLTDMKNLYPIMPSWYALISSMFLPNILLSIL